MQPDFTFTDFTFTQVKNAFQAIAGLESLSSADEFFLTSSLNRAVQRAYDESDSWPRYLVAGEERLLVDDQVVPYASGCNCTDLLAASEEKVDCLLGKLLPKELNGSVSWSYSTTSTRPDYGPPYGPSNPPPCTKTVSSNIQVQFVGGIQLKFCREDNSIPEDCAASGTIDWCISTTKDPLNCRSIGWSVTPNGQQSCKTKNYTLGITYYIFARGINLNENSLSEAYSYMGSFFVSLVGEITRTINTVNEFNEGDSLPCNLGLEPSP
jgi:hypothetical protein